MPDPTIRAALDAACRWMHEHCGEAENVEAWRYDAAGVIAAFLRALPPCDVLMDRPYPSGPHSTRTLARAVEAAVERAGEGVGDA